VISDVASYIKKAAKYNLYYDEEMDEAENPVIAFLSEYKEGVCRHYASAATLLFRTLGIPARYTIGFHCDVEGNVESEITAKQYHAWVEVYIGGLGWVNVEVTGSDKQEPIKLTVAPATTSDVYSGQTLNALQKVSGLDALVKEGYSYVATVDGSLSTLGKATSTITSLKIMDEFGETVYDSETGLGEDQFIITYKTGVIHLYISKLSFESDSKDKIYDGKPLETLLEECRLVIITSSISLME